MIIVYKEHFSSAYFISHIHVKGETVKASDKAGEKRPAWQGQGVRSLRPDIKLYKHV